MTWIKVSFEVDVPDCTTDWDSIVEWVRFELRDNGSMEADNPLKSESLTPVFPTLEIEDEAGNSVY